MSQERTERPEVLKQRCEELLLEAAQEKYRLKNEIDSLNAVIADREKHIEWMTKCAGSFEKRIDRLTAKVQDRDAEIIRQRERGDRLDGELQKQNCRNQDQAEEIERLSWSNGEQLKQIDILEINLNSRDEEVVQQRVEIERLHAEMELVLSITERAAEDFAQGQIGSIGLKLVNIKVNLRAALKGAE